MIIGSLNNNTGSNNLTISSIIASIVNYFIIVFCLCWIVGWKYGQIFSTMIFALFLLATYFIFCSANDLLKIDEKPPRDDDSL